MFLHIYAIAAVALVVIIMLGCVLAGMCKD